MCQDSPNGEWVSDVGLTQIDAEKQLAHCLCCLTKGVAMMALRDDLSLARTKAVIFPELETPVVKTYTKPFLHSTSYLFMAIAICVSLTGLLVSFVC